MANSRAIINRANHNEENSVAISHELLWDMTLSSNAKGIMITLLGDFDKHVYSRKELVDKCNVGYTKLNNALKELENHKYLHTYQKDNIQLFDFHLNDYRLTKEQHKAAIAGNMVKNGTIEWKGE